MRFGGLATLSGIDPRLPRSDQAVLAVAVVTGFVFNAPVVIPAWAALALLSAIAPGRAPVPFLMTTYVLPRLRGAEILEDPGPWRTAALVCATLLGLATLVLVVGDRGLAWALALPAAVHGALAGVGGTCLGCRLHRPR